jgi:hypothetical protein
MLPGYTEHHKSRQNKNIWPAKICNFQSKVKLSRYRHAGDKVERRGTVFILRSTKQILGEFTRNTALNRTQLDKLLLRVTTALL